MEVSTSKPLKPISNISEIVSKFTKVCKWRSIGVFPSQNSVQYQYQNLKASDKAPLGELCSDATEDTEDNVVKIHLQAIEVLNKSNLYDDSVVVKLFDIISALKSTYVQLQEAHVPYNTDKIIVADKLMVAQLEVLCKIKRAYKEKQLIEPKFDTSHSFALQGKLEENEKLLAELKSQLKDKNFDNKSLLKELQDLEMGNTKMIEKIRQVKLERRNRLVLNTDTFENVFISTSKSIHDFAKPLISLMKASGWDLDLAAKSIQNEAVYSKRCDKKYVFEAYIARRMLDGMELKTYDVDSIMRFDDPIDALIDNPDSEFAKFCGKKYLLVVHPTMEESFFGNLDQRTFVLSGKHPRTPFYHIFAKMAKWIWVLQGIAASIDPQVKAFSVKRGSKYSDVYMESVEEDKEAKTNVDGQHDQKVEFMVMPGFKVGETLVKSRVYLSQTN